MKKKLLLLVGILALSSLFIGCGEDNINNRYYVYPQSDQDNYGNSYSIVVDKETNLLYKRVDGNLCPDYDVDGKIKRDKHDWTKDRTMYPTQEGNK